MIEHAAAEASPTKPTKAINLSDLDDHIHTFTIHTLICRTHFFTTRHLRTYVIREMSQSETCKINSGPVKITCSPRFRLTRYRLQAQPAVVNPGHVHEHHFFSNAYQRIHPYVHICPTRLGLTSNLCACSNCSGVDQYLSSQVGTRCNAHHTRHAR